MVPKKYRHTVRQPGAGGNRMYENEIKPQTAVLVAVDTGEATIGVTIMFIRAGVLMEIECPQEIVYQVHQLHGDLQVLPVAIKQDAVLVLQVEK